MKSKGSSFYYESFTALASHALECASLLKNTKESSTQLLTKADRIRLTALGKRREALVSLADEFLPPVERSDAVRLVLALYALEETLAGSLRRCCAFGGLGGFEKIASNIGFYTKILYETVVNMQGAQKGKGFALTAEQADSLDIQTQKLIYEARKGLFSGERDAKKLLAGAQICDALSSCVNQCRLTKDVIDLIVISNS